MPEALPYFNEETLEQLGVPHKTFGRQPHSTLRPYSVKDLENIKDLNFCFLTGGSQHRNVQ